MHIGAPLSAVETAYGSLSEQDEELRLVSVDLANSPFSSATFYYGEKKRIYQILLFLDNEKSFPDDFLEKRLLSTFGEPTVTSNSGKHLAWNVNKEANVFFKRGESDVVITAKGLMPGSWPPE